VSPRSQPTQSQWIGHIIKASQFSSPLIVCVTDSFLVSLAQKQSVSVR